MLVSSLYVVAVQSKTHKGAFPSAGIFSTASETLVLIVLSLMKQEVFFILEWKNLKFLEK